MKDSPRVIISSSSETSLEASALLRLLREHGIAAEHTKQPRTSSKKEEPSAPWTQGLASYDFAIVLVLRSESSGERSAAAVPSSLVSSSELELLVGVLGPARVLLVSPGGSKRSDLALENSSIRRYEYDTRGGRGEATVGLDSVAREIVEEIRKQGKRSLDSIPTMSPDRIEDIFRLTGMTAAYPSRNDARPDMLGDMQRAKRSIRMYARVYLSELVRDTPGFASAIGAAASAFKGKLFVQSTTTDPTDKHLVGRMWALEDPFQTRWASVAEYRKHLKQARDAIHAAIDSAKLGLQSIKGRRPVSFQGRVVKLILPYSLLVVDDSVVYVSFYRLSHTTYGTHSPTLRLENDPKRVDWADTFLREARQIDDEYSSLVGEEQEL